MGSFTFFSYRVLSIWYVFCTDGASQFRPAMFQMSSSHTWPAATVLDSETQMLLRHPRRDTGLLCTGTRIGGGREEPIPGHRGRWSWNGCCLFQDSRPARLSPFWGSGEDVNGAQQAQRGSSLIGSETLMKCLLKGLLESVPASLSSGDCGEGCMLMFPPAVLSRAAHSLSLCGGRGRACVPRSLPGRKDESGERVFPRTGPAGWLAARRTLVVDNTE